MTLLTLTSLTHFNIGGIDCTIQFSCGPETSQKPSRRTMEGHYIFSISH